LERERRVPVVPVFWVAGDDHDFAEANHAAFLNTAGDAVNVVLRERAETAPQHSLSRERCGPEIDAALQKLETETPDSEFKAAVSAWLRAAYRPEASLADAGAAALHALLAERGLAVFQAHHPAAKRVAEPFVLRGLSVTLPDGLAPVMVEGSAGRDRLRPDGQGFVARRSGERFSRDEIEELARTAPERLSPNVLLRPAIEAALFPTVAYLGGPAELEYLPKAGPVYQALGVTPQAPWPRWSGMLIEARVDKILERHHLEPAEFAGPAGVLENRLVRDALPDDLRQLLDTLRGHLEADYGQLVELVKRVDPTLERTAVGARNAALGGTQDIEKKVVAAVKRSSETLVGQITRARAALYPNGEPQERVLTYASFAIRYGPSLLDHLTAEVARWADAS
jgi:bacillithiol synthase